jgi:hypothetical protein
MINKVHDRFISMIILNFPTLKDFQLLPFEMFGNLQI